LREAAVLYRTLASAAVAVARRAGRIDGAQGEAALDVLRPALAEAGEAAGQVEVEVAGVAP
jgi:hypothetical protein